jgi:tryptophanyl-tRNA synthetase
MQPNSTSNGVKNTIVSGIRASGKLHIGNYLGALKQFVELQNDSNNNCLFFIADLHAITTPFDPKDLTNNTLDVAADYLAAGIDPKKSTFFLQSQVPAHTELSWIFECITPLGELKRMTQFKDKSQQHPEGINAGLLTYPTLMAADILIYKGTQVPVGEDQSQHVEMTRIIARKFNNKFGKTFPEPKTFELKPLRVKSLSDPSKKMSKTGDEALMLDDTPEEIRRKLKKAVTATDTKHGSPGVDNLFLLLENFGNEDVLTNFRKQQKAGTIKYSELKETLAETIAKHFEDFRAKKAALLADKNRIINTLLEGSKQAQIIANATLTEVKTKIGFI